MSNEQRQTSAPAPPVVRRTLPTTFADAGRSLALVLGLGAACGLLVGGVGGHLAMFLLRLTSDPALAGEITDDGFVIGVITMESVFLLGAGTFVGVALAAIYVLAREWIPGRGRVLLFAIWTGALGGGAILHADGIDFNIVDPKWLAVALFIAIPLALGAALATVLERALRGRMPPVLAFLPLVTLPTGFLVVPTLLLCALLLALDRGGKADRLWRSPLVTWGGRIALAGGLAVGLAELSRDVPAIL